MKRFSPTDSGFVFLLGALSALSPLGIDMSLPAFAALAADFGESPARAALTLSAYMAGYSLAQLLFGPLSDRFGRRPVMLIGSAIFTLGGLAGTLAPSMSMLILSRLVQGAGAAAMTPIARAIVRDSCSDPRRARVLFSQINMALMVAPVIAPLAGSAFMAVFANSWRSIYFGLTLAGAAVFAFVWRAMPETLAEPDPRALSPRRLLANFRRFFTTRACIANAMIGAMSFGCTFAYVTGSSLVFISSLGFGPLAFAGTFGAISLCIIAGSFLNARLAAFGAPIRKVLRNGLAGACLGATMALAATLLLPSGAALWLLLPGLAVGAVSFGFIIPNTAHAALEPIADMAGAGSAMLGFLQMLVGALSSALVGWVYPALGVHAMAAVMLGFALSSACLFLVFLPAPRT